MTEEARKKYEEEVKAMVAAENKAREEVDVDKYFKACLNGEEAYNAVYLLFKLWSDTLDNDGLYQTIMSTMLTFFDKEQEWALCVKRVIDGRKPDMRNYLRDESEPIIGSCTCECTHPKKERY